MAALAVATTAGADQRSIFIHYAKIRTQTYGCVLDRVAHHFGNEQRRTCRRYRRLYEIYAINGESARFHLHCLTRRCPAAPDGEPDPRGPIPANSRVFRP